MYMSKTDCMVLLSAGLTTLRPRATCIAKEHQALACNGVLPTQVWALRGATARSRLARCGSMLVRIQGGRSHWYDRYIRYVPRQVTPVFFSDEPLAFSSQGSCSGSYRVVRGCPLTHFPTAAASIKPQSHIYKIGGRIVPLTDIYEVLCKSTYSLYNCMETQAGALAACNDYREVAHSY